MSDQSVDRITVKTHIVVLHSHVLGCSLLRLKVNCVRAGAFRTLLYRSRKLQMVKKVSQSSNSNASGHERRSRLGIISCLDLVEHF